MARILVTGGHGFIGHHLVAELSILGHEVVVLDNHDDYGIQETSKMDMLREERVQYIGNVPHINEDISTYEITDEFDVIYHLAGYPRQHETLLNKERAWTVAKNGLETVLSANPTSLTRVVYVSTSMVYGNFSCGVVETAPLRPTSEYGKYRLYCEQRLQEWSSSSGIDYTIVRPSAVYGPRDHTKRVVGKFFEHAIKGIPLEVRGRDEVLDFTHVNDLVRGLVACLSERAANTTFNITYSGTTPITLEAMARAIVQKVNSSVEIHYDDRDNAFPQRGRLCIDHASEYLDYVSCVDIYEGITDTYQWILSSPTWLDELST